MNWDDAKGLLGVFALGALIIGYIYALLISAESSND